MSGPDEGRMEQAIHAVRVLGDEIAGQLDEDWLPEAITDSVRVMESLLFAGALRLPA